MQNMSYRLTASQLLERMIKNVGIPWQSQRADGFDEGIHMGSPDTVVTGIATTFTPTYEVLKRSITAGKNTIICRETPFYSRGERAPVAWRNGTAPPKELLEKDATARAKTEFIESNKLVIIKLADNWDARKTDAQLRGLAMALDWGKYHLARKGDTDVYRPGNEYFSLPETSLGRLVAGIQSKLRLRGIRVIGNPESQVSKAALTHGFLLVAELQRVMAEPGVDFVVGGEPVEWEATEYFQDLIAAKMSKGLILLGNEGSEEPGSGEVAAWLKTFVKEVPVEWMPAGEPVWAES
jgi:putative NIF3 family GTP cyclohydrolase 1 type 2